MSEGPRTEAGKRLLAVWLEGRTHPPSTQRRLDFEELVLAIEAEARADVDGLAPEYDNHLFTGNDSKALENVVIALGHFDREADGSPCFCPTLDNVGSDGRAINELSHQPRCRSARIHLGVARGLAGDKAEAPE